MREYRGKRTDNGEWVEGGVLITENWASIFVCTDDLGSSDEPPSSDVTEYEVIPETVGMYAGEHISREKAFEGEVFKHMGDEIGVIKFGEYQNPFEVSKHIGFYVEWLSGRDKDILRKDLGYWLNSAAVEIVGNVYDNPELLKGGAE